MARKSRFTTERRYGAVYDLVASDNAGRLALGHAGGYDLTCGEGISVLLGGQWIDGCVEHYAVYLVGSSKQAMGGYYFVACDGNVCGLCVGMQVRLIG